MVSIKPLETLAVGLRLLLRLLFLLLSLFLLVGVDERRCSDDGPKVLLRRSLMDRVGVDAKALARPCFDSASLP